MKNTKSKVLVIALAICLIAVGSLNTLAWFTANDQVTNNFHIANSEDDADKIFSVNVWEDKTSEDVAGEEKIEDGIKFENILPGDEFFKEVHVENTGSYPQYIRATVTISDASVWQEVYGEYVVALDEFVDTIDASAIHTMVSYYDAVNDTLVYEIYYKDILEVGKDIVVFDTVKIDSRLDRFQAADLAGDFYINVFADAVQTENVGANVYEAFETVGLVKAAAVSDAAELAEILASDEEAYIIVDPALLTNNMLTIDTAIKNKIFDFNGQNANILFTENASAENVVVSGIVDTDGQGYSVETNAAFTGDLKIIGCDFIDQSGGKFGAVRPAGGNVTIENCEFVGIGKSYGVRTDHRTGNLTIANCTFNNLGSWAILVNGTNNGDLTVDNCTFETPDGVLKTLGGGVTGNFTFTNNTMIGCKGHDKNINKLVVSGSGTGPVVAGGVKTVSGNTLDGAAWEQN